MTAIDPGDVARQTLDLLRRYELGQVRDRSAVDDGRGADAAQQGRDIEVCLTVGVGADDLFDFVRERAHLIRVHVGSSSVGPDGATSGNVPTVGVGGDGARGVDSSSAAGTVTEDVSLDEVRAFAVALADALHAGSGRAL